MSLTKEQQLLQTIITKAWKDDRFKQDLISNPIKAIESIKEMSIKLPEGKTIVVCDQTEEAIIYINIPAKLNIDDVELDEAQLEVVAGGGKLTEPIIRGFI